jgi:peptidoglycan hydrolase CwlO-like protein
VSTARLLPVLNAIGCLVLVGFILVQWRGGQALSRELYESRSREILEKNARFDAEKLSRQLQADLDGLKASVDSIQQAAEVAEKELATKNEEIGKFATGLAQATEQIKTWEVAVKERDEAILKRDAAIAERDSKLKELNDQLVATRKRLDEAVAELKKAGAR